MGGEKAGVGIFSPTLAWSFPLRLLDFTPIFRAELFAMILALRKYLLDALTAIITDSLCSHLAHSFVKLPGSQDVHVISSTSDEFNYCGYQGTVDWNEMWNEMADCLVRASLSGPIISILPVEVRVTATRYRNFSIYWDKIETITPATEHQHLEFP